MRTKVLSLNDQNINHISLLNYFVPDELSSVNRERMQKIITAAIHRELTERQCICIELYYLKRMKVKDIAAILEIKPTTVYKHLKKGLCSLKKCAVYL